MNAMPRIALAAALMGALMAMQATAQSPAAQSPRAIEGQALDTAPDSRAEAAQAIDAALAAALIGAISSQFGERQVEVKLDRVATDPVNLIDLGVSGEGRLRIGDAAEWLPVRFTGLYDSVEASVVQPQLTIGQDVTGETVALASPIARGLQREAASQLQQEFANQHAELRLDKVDQVAAGSRYLRVEGVGAARFDEGTAPVDVHGLYDRQTKQWLRVAYELASSTSDLQPAQLTAAR